MQFVLGPDFPTGATILGRVGIGEATAPGAARSACARSPRSTKTRGGQRIVVTEVPYQTSVEVIGQKIAELVNDRRSRASATSATSRPATRCASSST